MIYTILLHIYPRVYDTTGSAEVGWQHIAILIALLIFIGYFFWRATR